MNRIIFISFLLLVPFSMSAQDTGRNSYDALKKELNKRLAFLEKYNYWDNQDFDIEKYSGKTAVLLTKFLAIDHSDTGYKALKNLNLATQTNDSLQIRIYDFGYNCGGTRGWITHPVIQWRDRSGALHAYNLSKKIYASFNKIHKLNPVSGGLYLLIGSEKGNSSTIQNIAYVLKFDGKNIYTTYNAFINRSYINLPNTGLSFDDKSQTLKCINDTYTDDFKLHLEYIEPTNDTTATKKLLQMFSREYDGPVCFKFVGGKFIRQAKCR